VRSPPFPSYIFFSRIGWIDTIYPLVVPAWLGGGAFLVFLFSTTALYQQIRGGDLTTMEPEGLSGRAAPTSETRQKSAPAPPAATAPLLKAA